MAQGIREDGECARAWPGARPSSWTGSTAGRLGGGRSNLRGRQRPGVQHRWHVPAAETEAVFSRPSAVLACPEAVSLVAWCEGRPVGAAQAFSGDAIGGIYWVGTVDEMRGRGSLAREVSVATNIVFDRGGGQHPAVSPMAESIYRLMGYVTLYHLCSRIFRKPVRSNAQPLQELES